MKKILIIDDNPAAQMNFESAFDEIRAPVTITMVTPRDATQVYLEATENFDLVVADLLMPGFNGIEFISFLATFPAPCPLIICSDATQAQIKAGALLAKTLGVKLASINKPVESEQLRHIMSFIE